MPSKGGTLSVSGNFSESNLSNRQGGSFNKLLVGLRRKRQQTLTELGSGVHTKVHPVLIRLNQSNDGDVTD